ncbi:hypothetical protein TorRG33x02_032340 [Trema orientale]|uniref:RNase H type-1 domain-containing protein n=1 Tax=Trema orientale TaxID=63057 RepID=A0A2P5FTD8_TREOI|nr:hypothetical protein TorRG33x02_032340 [Trema orientale]
MLEVFVVTLWSLWKERNNVKHGSRGRRPNKVQESAGRFLHEFQQTRLKVDGALLPKNRPVCDKWKCPLAGHLKLNVDAAIDSTSNSIGVGGVLKDNNGNVIDALGYAAHMLESDCLSAVMAANAKVGLSTEAILIGDIQSLFLDCQVGSCSFVARESNTMAHTLAKLYFKDDFMFSGFDDILRCIAHYVASDLG